jgi:hypothetical protein
VAFIDADRVDYYHRLERERIHVPLIDDARRGLADIAAGRSFETDGAIGPLQQLRKTAAKPSCTAGPEKLTTRRRGCSVAPGRADLGFPGGRPETTSRPCAAGLAVLPCIGHRQVQKTRPSSRNQARKTAGPESPAPAAPSMGSMRLLSAEPPPAGRARQSTAPA